MSDGTPITAVITWAAMEGPAVPSAHRYRGTVNMPGGQVWPNIDIGRPGEEVWWPDQLVMPLKINARIHGDLMGNVMQWDYTERPVIGTCADLPGGGGLPSPGLSGGLVPDGGSGSRPLQPQRFFLRATDPAMRMAITSTPESLAILLDAMEAARRARP